MSMRRQSSISYNGIDSETPLNEHLNAKYMKTFAFYTVKDRLPVILTKVVDHLVRSKEELVQKYGPETEEDMKDVIGQISKLKNEVQTNKQIVEIQSNGEDVGEWNKYLSSQEELDDPPCWFQSHWLYVECYMYRRLWEIFENSKALQKFDPFEKQKRDSFEIALSELKIVSKMTLSILKSLESSRDDLRIKFVELLKICLWGNRCDLSLSNGALLSEEESILSNVKLLDQCILRDDSEKVFELLEAHPKKLIDFVFDNAAYELFTDFCFCDFLMTSSLASSIRFHAKKIPWYVSDVTRRDVDILLNSMESEGLTELTQRWRTYFRKGVWTLHDEKYWTTPFDYNDMKDRDSALFNSLSQSQLIIFKGDLNYRKLLGDINWDHSQKFEIALRAFRPTSILSLRTVKCDLICGLPHGKSKELTEKDPIWMRTGEYGLIKLYVHKCG